MKSRTDYANIILGFLQNIDDEADAQEFTRIALDALENADEHSNTDCADFDRASLMMEIVSVDARMADDRGFGECLAVFEASGYTGGGVTAYLDSRKNHDPMDDDPNRNRDPK